MARATGKVTARAWASHWVPRTAGWWDRQRARVMGQVRATRLEAALGRAKAPTMDTYVGMAYIIMAYVVMACLFMVWTVMAYIVMAYVVMAHRFMAYIVIAKSLEGALG